MTVTSQSAVESTGTVSKVAKWAPLAVILCGTFVSVLDFFIVNVAIPAIQHNLRAGPAAVEWVIAGYGLTSASFLVCGGRLGDHYGRRRLFMIGVAVFTITSALCAVAPNPQTLIAARLAQGIGVAFLAPNVLSILGTTYTGPDRVRAISVYGMVMGAAAAGGQIIGGLLISANVLDLGWRAIFWVNVPVGVAAIVAAPRLVPESRTAGTGRLDVTGAVTLTAGLTAIVLPLLDGRQEGWPAWSWASLAAGPVLLAAFTVHLYRTTNRGGQPLLDPAIFAIRAFRSGLTCQVLFWCQQAAGYLLLALYLQEGRGLTPIESGGMFSILAAGYLVTSFPAPKLTVRFGRPVVAIGALLGALGDILLIAAVWHSGAAGGAGPLVFLAPGLLLLGAGQGLCITPLTTTVLSHSSQRTAGSVSGALATAQQVGNAIGVAISGVVFYGLLDRGYGIAYGWSVAEMAALLLGVAALTFLIPKKAG
ncbi:MAG TPA: MFS transporter [Trebonia sp.]|jgi:EmrB/QacA subfamily drug resistance transporter|nr:MFS transporter [Trebonia sp.]